MTPEKKAEDLILKFGNTMAILVVREILEALEEFDNVTEKFLQKEFPDFGSFQLQNMDWDFRYWGKVEQILKSKV